jgi:hypothetical protein
MFPFCLAFVEWHWEAFLARPISWKWLEWEFDDDHIDFRQTRSLLRVLQQSNSFKKTPMHHRLNSAETSRFHQGCNFEMAMLATSPIISNHIALQVEELSEIIVGPVVCCDWFQQSWSCEYHSSGASHIRRRSRLFGKSFISWLWLFCSFFNCSKDCMNVLDRIKWNHPFLRCGRLTFTDYIALNLTRIRTWWDNERNNVGMEV